MVVDGTPEPAVNPTYFIGLFAPAAIISPGDVNALSTNVFISNALLPDTKSATSEVGYIDVRVAALAMIAGINTSAKTRNLLTGEWFELKDAVDYIGTLHPESRIPTLPLSGQSPRWFSRSRRTGFLRGSIWTVRED
jgi:hypothetical protein